ncbi:MAG: 4Fe-4S dicluster domain-containing protein [Thermotoga sp.]|nr:4Fe-4S dicluster domain-containing protein [Thermotoga sp.]
MMDVRRILIREEYCIGCKLCEINCVAAQVGTGNLIKIFRYEPELPEPNVIVEEHDYVTFALQCRNCDDPSCLKACMTGAMYRDPKTGAIRVNQEKCVGCWMCIMACPFGAVRRSTKEKKVASKCDLCIDRGTPACVEGCPNEALVLVEVRE